MKIPNPFNNVSFADRLMFTKHMAIMVRSGVPIYEVLETLVDNAKSKYFKLVLENVLHNLENGKSLYQSMSNFPNVFDKFYVNLIKISEESGTLEENLEFLSKQMDKDYALRRKVKGALFYPAIIVSVGLGMGAFISLFVLPKLITFFESVNMELPLTTRVLLFVANLMDSHGVLIFSGLALFIVIFIILIQTRYVKPLWHKAIITMPIFGKIILFGQLARFTRNFGTLMRSGVPVSASLDTSAATLGNIVLERNFNSIKILLNEGKNIGDALDMKKFPEIPTFVIKMIKIGEKTGNLEEVLLYISEFYEDEVDNLTKNLTTVLEPILLVIIGLVVGFMALAIIGPIYELTGSIN